MEALPYIQHPILLSWPRYPGVLSTALWTQLCPITGTRIPTAALRCHNPLLRLWQVGALGPGRLATLAANAVPETQAPEPRIPEPPQTYPERAPRRNEKARRRTPRIGPKLPGEKTSDATQNRGIPKPRDVGLAATHGQSRTRRKAATKAGDKKGRKNAATPKGAGAWRARAAQDPTKETKPQKPGAPPHSEKKGKCWKSRGETTKQGNPIEPERAHLSTQNHSKRTDKQDPNGQKTPKPRESHPNNGRPRTQQPQKRELNDKSKHNKNA